MIIRSQRKTVILNVEYVTDIYIKEEESQNEESLMFQVRTNDVILGRYLTEQKAIKVLDMICDHMEEMHFAEMEQNKCIQVCSNIFNMPQDDEVQTDTLFNNKKGSIMENFIGGMLDRLKEERNKVDRTIKSKFCPPSDLMCKRDAFDESIDIIRQFAEKYKDCLLIPTGGLDEGIKCAMCTNSMKSDTGCDGGCSINNDMYKRVLDTINRHAKI